MKIAVAGINYVLYYRPEMTYFSFTKKILNGEAIDVFNNGEMQRDFTYIDDIVEGITRVVDKFSQSKISNITNAQAPYKI